MVTPPARVVNVALPAVELLKKSAVPASVITAFPAVAGPVPGSALLLVLNTSIPAKLTSIVAFPPVGPVGPLIAVNTTFPPELTVKVAWSALVASANVVVPPLFVVIFEVPALELVVKVRFALFVILALPVVELPKSNVKSKKAL